MNAKTRRGRVRHLLWDGMWHSTMEVCAPDVGGSEGCRRLRELRTEMRKGKTHDIIKRRCEEGSQYEYRIVRMEKPNG